MQKKASILLSVLMVIALVFSVMPTAYAAQNEEPATAVAGEQGEEAGNGDGSMTLSAPDDGDATTEDETATATDATMEEETAEEETAEEETAEEETAEEETAEEETAEEEQETPEAKPITGFVVLEDDAANDINVAQGTPESAIPFPQSVTAIVGGGEQDEQLEIPVGEWVNTVGPYDPETPRPYMFAPVRDSLELPDGVTLPDAVALPRLRVVVGEVVITPQPLALSVSSLIFESGSPSASGDGYAWNGGSNTLTLTNADITFTGSNGLRVPDGTTIVLNGTNTLTNTVGGGLSSEAIRCMGSLTIKEGSPGGTLSATGSVVNSGTNRRSYGIMTLGALTVQSGTVTATGGNGSGDVFSYGVYAEDGDITISGGSLFGTGGSGVGRTSIGVEAYDGNIIVAEDAVLKGRTLSSYNGSGSFTAISADDSVTIGASARAKGSTDGNTGNLVNAVFDDGAFRTAAGGTAMKYVEILVPPALQSIAVTTPPTKTTYVAGETFSKAGMVVTASYDNATTAPVTTYTVAPAGALALGTTSVTISYTEESVTKTTTQTITVNPPPPSAPENFTATAGNEQVVLSWAAPTSDGGSPITKYEVSSNNGSTWGTADTDTGHTFTGLTNGTEYTFKVRAVNAGGDGAEASQTATPRTIPGVPTSFTATRGNAQVALSWAAPASNGGAAITKYEVSSDNGADWVEASSTTGHTFTSLNNGTAYTFKVRAVNVAGAGAEASQTATPATTPSAPENFTATAGDRQVALSWETPASDGGEAITGYQVSKDNGATWETAASNTSHTFTNLTNGTEYTFKVYAVNSEGNGAQASATATPRALLDSIAVTTVPDDVDYVAGQSFDNTGMVVTATYTDSTTAPVTGYTVSPSGALAVTDTTVTISYIENGVTKETTQAITVIPVGSSEIITAPTGGAPATNLPDPNAVLNAVLTAQDRLDISNGIDIHFSLEVKVQNASATDAALVAGALGDNTLGMYLDLSMVKTKDGDAEPPITQLSAPIRIVLDIPAHLRGAGRSFRIIRVHSGVVAVLNDLDSNPNTITIETDRFSPYALVYNDAPPAPPPAPAPAPAPVVPVAVFTAPQTGDTSNIMLWQGLLLVAIFGIGALLWMYRHRNDKKSEEAESR